MPNAGQRISEYVLDAPLGKGAFGEVWRARHHVWSDQIVAVKIPLHPDYVRQLQREGASMHGLAHVNIVRPIGFDPFATPPYLVMEYVPGTNLRELIKSRALSSDDAVKILRQILAGLAYAHSQGLIHRDIKPENILIHEKSKTEGFAAPGVVKISDFGLGQAASSMAKESIVLSTSLDGSAASELAGTIDYMSPEQRSAQPVDARTDLYAVGVILYEMLTGEKPAGTELPSDRNRNAPKFLDEVFRKSYARLDRRYQSAEQFAADLGSETGAPSARRAPATTVPPVGPTIPIDRRCPACRSNVGLGDQFCTACGVQLVATVRRCPKCGAYPDNADRFCVFCGSDVPPLMVLTA